jgi:hypothetical protein
VGRTLPFSLRKVGENEEEEPGDVTEIGELEEDLWDSSESEELLSQLSAGDGVVQFMDNPPVG